MRHIQHGWKYLFIGIGFLFLSCAGRQTAILDRPLRPAQPAANATALQKDAETLWAQRSDPQKARQAVEAYKRAFAANPSKEIGTRLARAYHFVGYYVETAPAAQDSLFGRGAEIGERVLSLHEEFRLKYLKTKDDRRALAALDASWAAAIYWTAANLERWRNLQEWRVRYGNKGRVEIYMTRVRELDPNFYFGAPYRFFGVLPTRGRAPFVDLDDAKREFDKAVGIAPNFLGNKRLYAETYAVKKKDRALFQNLLEQVINGNANALPDIAPENKYEQAIAKKMLAKSDEYFEKKDKNGKK
jgi:hypothetical protein